ncbi:acyl carrier protein [Flavobacterium sp. KACC 22763]|uniref:acyl carrier protein n=1 Tax=Flavobacterium sp. KACC 22763 TaxID=3025668 RepID=UPI002365B3FA|nr:acyl carrier protein [Flavobacterium sp. KACC 22763]WDF62902.1 acyl carrier protein [Flavobacterium sp. KACC 22763]
MEKFIENFKRQLEDVDTDLNADTDYVNSDFWDSLTAVTIQMMIDDEYNVKIDIKKISSFTSVGELYHFVQESK